MGVLYGSTSFTQRYKNEINPKCPLGRENFAELIRKHYESNEPLDVHSMAVDVIPVEVKDGERIRSKSMNIFITKYKCAYGIRISKKNFGFENGIKSVPLYTVFCI